MVRTCASTKDAAAKYARRCARVVASSKGRSRPKPCTLAAASVSPYVRNSPHAFHASDGAPAGAWRLAFDGSDTFSTGYLQRDAKCQPPGQQAERARPGDCGFDSGWITSRSTPLARCAAGVACAGPPPGRRVPSPPTGRGRRVRVDRCHLAAGALGQRAGVRLVARVVVDRAERDARRVVVRLRPRRRLLAYRGALADVGMENLADALGRIALVAEVERQRHPARVLVPHAGRERAGAVGQHLRRVGPPPSEQRRAGDAARRRLRVRIREDRAAVGERVDVRQERLGLTERAADGTHVVDGEHNDVHCCDLPEQPEVVCQAGFRNPHGGADTQNRTPR